MPKRKAEQITGAKVARTGDKSAPPVTIDPSTTENDSDLGIEGGMEDLPGDESEEEEIVELDGEEDDLMGEDAEETPEEAYERSKEKAERLLQREAKEQEEEHKVKNGEGRIYLPHRSRPLGPDEVLEPDPTVYEMLHNVNMPWPCLSLDIVADNLGSQRRGYPATMYVVTGTQAGAAKDNEVMLLKLSSLNKTLEKADGESDEEEEEEDEEDDSKGPILESENVEVRSTTNRIRMSPLAAETGRYLTATFHENGEVCIFDLASQFRAFDTPGYTIPKPAKRPIRVVQKHGNVEGYGLDWSPLRREGALLSGDVSGRIYLTENKGSKWVSEKQPFTVDNNCSIEDIQWSRSEKTVFATGGVDGQVRIWDTRATKHVPALSVAASQSDVNVLSWCNKIDYLLASGHDDGTWGIWDLRAFKPQSTPSPVVSYDFHKSPITSIQFNPLDESIVAVASEDNTVTLWDLAVEADDEEIRQQRSRNEELADIPPQLLFVHWQKDVKEVRWHPQIPGALVSTGTGGINVWKTISV